MENPAASASINSKNSKPVNAPSSKRRKGIALLFGFLVFLVLWVVDIPGLNPNGRHALAVAVMIALWWIFNVMPPAFPALLACVLYFTLGIAKPPEAFSGFVSPSIWMFLFAMIMAKGVERSGLGKRIAAWMLSKTAPSFNGLVFVLIALCVIFPFFIPSTVATVSLIMALAIGIMDAIGIERGPNNKISCGLTCFVAILVLLIGRIPLTGSVPNFVATGLVRDIAGVEISWIDWLKSMWVAAPLPAIATYFYVTRLYKPDIPLSREVIKRQIDATVANLGPWSGAEIRTALLVSAAILLWIFGSYLKIGTSQVGIVIGILFLMPYVGFLTMADFKALSWDTWLFAGGSYSMGVVLTKAGFAQWAASGIAGMSFLDGASFVTIGFVVVIFAFSLHFLLETLGNVSLLTPIILKTGLLTPRATAMLLPYGAGFYAFPFQGAPIILSLGFNTTGWKDVTRYAIFIAFIGIGQSLPLLASYWRFTMQ